MKQLKKFDERKKKTREIKFQLETELYNTLKKLSEDYDITLSRLIRGLLRTALKDLLLKEDEAKGLMLFKN